MVQPAIRIDNPHTVVVTGNILLKDQIVLIGTPVDGFCDGIIFCPVIGKEYFFLVRERAVPVSRRIAGLDDDRERKRQFNRAVILRGAGCGFGVGKAVFLTGTVEVILDIQRKDCLQLRAGKVVVRAQCLPVARHKNGISVRAGDKHKRLVRMGFGEFNQGAFKNFIVLQLRFQYGNLYKV